MRVLFLAGAAIVALSSVTSVQAGPVWHAKKTLSECVLINVIGGVKQFNCATDVVSSDDATSDYNTQTI
ncbi:MAG: hypothetical protein JWQ89_2378, partial [Devosia sp.]|uniref:hypothetical protein n=1 Tax=Devosia sp. TaxID=1871048 RepID=UPI0026276CF9